ERISQILRRKRDTGLDIGSVFGGHDKVSQLRVQLTLKTIKVFFYQCASDFPSAIRAEVHKNNGIAIVDSGHFFIFAANYRRFDEFIIFIAGVSSAQSFYSGQSIELGIASYHDIVSRFNAIPTVIPIQSKVATADRGNAPYP